MRATLLLCLLGLLGACGSSIPPRPTASVASPPHSEAASSPTVNASPADEFASLARALRLPALATGEACPRSSGRQISKAFGPAFGDGPVYPVFGSDENVIRPSTIDGGYRAKVLWVSDATYQGPVLIRGAQIDGAGVITFTAEGSPSTSDLRLLRASVTSEQEPTGWREWPSYTDVAGSGCYAYQVDGTFGTTVIAFSADAR
jgi:hypothetical protein